MNGKLLSDCSFDEMKNILEKNSKLYEKAFDDYVDYIYDILNDEYLYGLWNYANSSFSIGSPCNIDVFDYDGFLDWINDIQNSTPILSDRYEDDLNKANDLKERLYTIDPKFEEEFEDTEVKYHDAVDIVIGELEDAIELMCNDVYDIENLTDSFMSSPTFEEYCEDMYVDSNYKVYKVIPEHVEYFD